MMKKQISVILVTKCVLQKGVDIIAVLMNSDLDELAYFFHFGVTLH